MASTSSWWRLVALRAPALSCLLVSCATVVGCGNPDHEIRPVAFGSTSLHEQLEPLGRAIGDSRIVLLGENGHGVGDFTEAKVELVEWLHEEHGFEVIAFESGFFECGHVWNRIDTLSSVDALYQCLRYPFQHAELVPLFDLIRAKHATERPLVLAGTDIQAQGYDSEPRPATLRGVLEPTDPRLAERLAEVDTALFLMEEAGGRGDDVHAWAVEHGTDAKAVYESAAAATDGWEHWVFRLATGWIDRVTLRGEAELRDEPRPVRYYEVRDEWMARAVSALADAIDGPRKIVVWLHNDHGRYGSITTDAGRYRSAGSYLREQYGDDVFSVGFFMGSGKIANNGRRIREVAEPAPDSIERFLRSSGATDAPACYLVLRGNGNADIRAWATAERAYHRMGTTPMTMVPADEFDALVYIDRVSPPDYEIR